MNDGDRDQTTGRFLAGNSGNGGRKVGARNKLEDVFLRAMYEDFAERGAAAIEEVRRSDPGTYLRVAASLLPKDVNLHAPRNDLSIDEFAERFKDLITRATGKPLPLLEPANSALPAVTNGADPKAH